MKGRASGLLTFGVKAGRISSASAMRSGLQSWSGNLLGSILVAWLFWQTGGGKLLPDGASLVHSAALAKTQLPVVALIKARVTGRSVIDYDPAESA